MDQDALDRYADCAVVVLAAAMVGTLSAVIIFDRGHTYTWAPMLFASALLLAVLFKASLEVSGRLLTTPPHGSQHLQPPDFTDAYQSLLARVRKLEAAAVTGAPAYEPSFDVESGEAKIARSIGVTVEELREQETAEKFRIRQIMEESARAELHRVQKKGWREGLPVEPQSDWLGRWQPPYQAYRPEHPPLAEERPAKIETGTSNGSVLKRKTLGEMVEGGVVTANAGPAKLDAAGSEETHTDTSDQRRLIASQGLEDLMLGRKPEEDMTGACSCLCEEAMREAEDAAMYAWRRECGRRKAEKDKQARWRDTLGGGRWQPEWITPGAASSDELKDQEEGGSMQEAQQDDVPEYSDLESSFSTNFTTSGAQDYAAPIDIGSGFRNSF